MPDTQSPHGHEYERLAAENLRMKTVQPVSPTTNVYIYSVLALCLMTATFVVVISIFRAGQDNTGLIATVVGVIVPVIVGLMAGTQHQMHSAVNSRLSQLLELTAVASRAEGVVAAVTMKEGTGSAGPTSSPSATAIVNGSSPTVVSTGTKPLPITVVVAAPPVVDVVVKPLNPPEK